MSKLAWVLLPLLIAAAAALALVLAGRRPSRLGLNVASSLLLLVYVATTAGLGIFWVANQHLPVFDWHYLFGYATVLLLALHLWLNFPTAWRWLKRPQPVREPTAAGRRPALALLGTATGLGAAFWLGLRHGRTEIQVAAGGASAATDLELVERFHAHSSHSRQGVLRQAPSTDWGEPPQPFKTYAGRETLALARGAGTGALLWHVAGVRERQGGINFRTAPSSGALFSTELYLVAYRLNDVPPGLWHYAPQSDSIVRLAEAPPAASEFGVDGAPAALVVASAIFRRSGHKYRDRTYRYVLADLGHALENLRLTALALGHTPALVPGFDGARVAQALGIKEAEEGVLALATIDAAPLVAEPGARWTAPPLPVGQSLGVTQAIHGASALQRAPTVVPHEPHEPPVAAPAETVVLPRARGLEGDMRALIARRRSWRRYSADPLPLAPLSALLQAMAMAKPSLSTAIRIDVVTPAVLGLAPRSWRYDPAQHRLLARTPPGQDLRRRARAAALDQDVVGDAAAVFVLAIDRLGYAADPLGPARGYRHALLEAGLVGERIYLQGTALGLGVCAVGAFYDEEATQLVGADVSREWVVHFAAVGLPA